MLLRTLEDEQLLKDAYESIIANCQKQILDIINKCPYLTNEEKKELHESVDNTWIDSLTVKIYLMRHLKDNTNNASDIVDWEEKYIDDDFDKSCRTLTEYHFKQTFYKRFLPSKIVEFNNVDIIITDPCYLIRDDDWREKLDNDLNDDFDLSPLGITNYCCKETLYGDWSCTMFDVSNNKAIGSFCADAGLVGVFNLQEMLKYNKEEIERFLEKSSWCYTIIKGFTGTAQIATKVVDNNPDEMLNQSSYERIVLIKGTIDGNPVEYLGSQTGL